MLIDLQKEYQEYSGINIKLIADNIGIDQRTVRLHCELLEEDGIGKFCDPNKETFKLQNGKTRRSKENNNGRD